MAYMPYNNYKGEYMSDFKVIAYEKENGEVPVEEFLDSVNPKMRAKIFGLLGILQERGKNYTNQWFCKEDSENSQRRDTTCKR